ncbi:MAG: hypothetical protein ACK40U_02865, partial [Fervidobacterium pennivorans]
SVSILVLMDVGLKLIASAKVQIDALAKACQTLTVVDDYSLEKGKELAKEAKRIENFIEEKRKEATKPLLERKKQIDDFAKMLTANLNNAVKSLRQQIQKYEEEKERRRIEELRRLEEERRRKEEELLQAQKQNDVSQFEKIQELQQFEQKVSQLSEKSSSLRMVWTFEVVDINAVPREYLVLDETAVRRAIQAGIREIPGLKIYQKPLLYIR